MIRARSSGLAQARMVFAVTPPGHEIYMRELGALVARPGPPDPDAIAALRARHDIQQLTPWHRVAAINPIDNPERDDDDVVPPVSV